MDTENNKLSLFDYFFKKEFTNQDLFTCAFRENFWN